MPNTTTGDVEAKLVELKQSGNAVALGRVLTLVILGEAEDPDSNEVLIAEPAYPGDLGTKNGGCDHNCQALTEHGHDLHVNAEDAIKAANEASREHPARILALTGEPDDDAKLDAQVRIGGDAGASEVVLLNLSGPLRHQSEAVITPLLVPDVPIVAWWPNHAPRHPAEDPVGKVAKLRITDSNHCSNGAAVLERLAAEYQPGDTDLAWTRLTGWRAQIAAALDIADDSPVTKATVVGMPDRASAWLLAGWLAVQLGCPTEFVPEPGAIGVTKVTLSKPSGDIVFDRPDGHTLSITQPGYPERHIALPLTSLSEALTEELRRLDADRIYEKVLTKGRKLVTSPASVPVTKPTAADSIADS